MIEVQKRTYGVYIFDRETYEGVAIETKDVKKLITDLQDMLPWDFNQAAPLRLT